MDPAIEPWRIEISIASAHKISFIIAYQYAVGTKSAGIAPGEVVYEEMELHPSLRKGGLSSHPNGTE